MSPTLSAAVAKNLLEKLSTDDAFRDLFVTDPAKALEKAGYDSTDKAVAAQNATLSVCCKVRELASKETIQASFDELLAMFTSGLGQITPALDAGLSADLRTLK